MGRIEELKIKDILHVLRQVKVHSAEPEDNIQSAMNKMAEMDISSLPIVEENKIVGIASDQDFVNGWRVGLDRHIDKVSVIMTPGADLVTVCLETKVLDALDLLDKRHIRHLPVLDEEELLVGFLSQRGIIKALNELNVKEEYFEAQLRILEQAL